MNTQKGINTIQLFFQYIVSRQKERIENEDESFLKTNS
jgi:hypothetical protein